MRVCLLFLLFLSGSVRGQDTAEDPRKRLIFPAATQEPAPAPPPEKILEPMALINAFFLGLKAGQVEAAYEALVKNTVISERHENVSELKERTKQALENYGPVAGFEVVDSLEVGASLRRHTCISLNEDLPLRWRFYFYKSAAGWKLVDLRVDDGLVELFDEVARSRKK